MSPTSRSLKWLRDKGYTVAITERWNSYAKVRVDLFGFADLLCLGDGEIIAVQVTSGANHSARRDKLNRLENVEKFVIKL